MRLIFSLFILISAAECADFTTFIGGTSVNPGMDTGVSVTALATDSAGDTYVTDTGSGSSGGFITKLDSTGNIVAATPIPGKCCSYGSAIAIDSTGNVWVAGTTTSPNFPLLNALQSTPVQGPQSTFLLKMAPAGTVLYSSYFGGIMGGTNVTGIATDSSGNVYMTGFTDASDFPTTSGLPASPVIANGLSTVFGAFAAKLNPTGQNIIYSTVIAGTVLDCPGGIFCNGLFAAGSSIAVDAAGDAFVAGNTDVTDLPVTTGGTSASGAFAFKINSAGSQLDYLTYIGPPVGVINDVWTSTGVGYAPIAADAAGNAYIVGSTNSPNFQGTPGAYQTTYTGGANAEPFALKLSPDGTTIWATFSTVASAVSLDSLDNLWLTGGNVVAELSADGSAIPYSTQFPSNGAGQCIAIDPSGVIHVADSTGLISTITPGNLPAPRVLGVLNAAGGVGQISIGLVAPTEVISLYGFGLGPVTPVTATPEGGLFPTSLAGVQVLVNGTPVPLLYVSATQINAEIPSPLQGLENGGVANGIALVQVMNDAVPVPAFRLGVANSDFAVFEKDGGSMAVINQDGTVNRIANPAKLGSTVSIWATGFGVTGPPADGAVAPAANNYCSACQLTLTIGETSVTETVQYAGTSPGLIDGLMQINFVIPTELPFNGAWVYFTPPGYTEQLQLGWVDVTQ
jgi:uncharacterized protein (TIGR03437 family)